MTELFPAYYEAFYCIASACRHSCCIGWEIDIDEDTADYYAALPGEMGVRLRENINAGNPSSFRLTEGERCPFLNGENLCTLILTLGEDSLCEICTEHPRFHNWYDDRTESGLGLCCEAAAALIMGQTEPFSVVQRGAAPAEDPLFSLRTQVLAILTDRSRGLQERCRDALTLCGGDRRMLGTPEQWIKAYLALEQLEPEWTAELQRLQRGFAAVDFTAFSAAAAAWETEYEQLLCYFVFRHFLTMSEAYGPAPAIGFALLSCSMIYALQAQRFGEKGTINFDVRVDYARRYSAEIEYSDENPDSLLEQLAQTTE